MNPVKGTFGKVWNETDCLTFMRSKPDKYYKLVFSDVPWGQDYDGTKPHGINTQTEHPERINYPDTWDPIFNEALIKEAVRVADMIVFCPGWIHFNWWVTHMDPLGYIMVTFKNGQNSTKVSRYQATAPYLCLGDGFKKHKFYRNAYFFNAEIIETYIQNGFLRDKSYIYNHPSPKDFKAWYQMIRDLHLESTDIIYDPCGGSCPIGEVGEALGQPWEATELLNFEKDQIHRIGKGQVFYTKHQDPNYYLKKNFGVK